MLSRLANGKSKIDSHTFRSLMGQGKIKSALIFLSRDQFGNVLGLNEIFPQSQGITTRDILTEKHLPGNNLGGGDGTGGVYFIQNAGVYAFVETAEVILSCHQLAEMQAIICCHSHFHYVHPGDQVIQQKTPCNI